MNHLLKQEPEVLSVAYDFSNLEDAKHISFPNLTAEIAKISVGIGLANRLVEASSADNSLEENPKLREYLDSIVITSKWAESKGEEAVQNFSRTCGFLGEPISDPETLFGQLQAFMQSIAKSAKDLQAKAKKPIVSTAPPSLKNIF